MKIYVSLIFFLMFTFVCNSQNLDNSIKDMSKDLAVKLMKSNKVKIAIMDFVYSDGKTDDLTDYIRGEIELNLINSDCGIQVMDRKQFRQLLAEHHLQSEGLMDESTAKSSIAFIKTDGYLFGQITQIGEKIKIKVVVKDVSNSQSFAASESDYIFDVAINKLLETEKRLCSECNGTGIIKSLKTCTTCNGKGGFTCPDCRGTGKLAKGFYAPGTSGYQRCDGCNGKGIINCNTCNGKGQMTIAAICPKCNGAIQGTSVHSSTHEDPQIAKCSACDGSGKIKSLIKCRKCYGRGDIVMQGRIIICPDCAGAGKLAILSPCPECDGSGLSK